MKDSKPKTKIINGKSNETAFPYPRFKLTIEYLDQPDHKPTVIESNSIVLFTGEVTNWIEKPMKPDIAVNMATVGDTLVNNVVLNNAPELVKRFYKQQAAEMQNRQQRKQNPN